MIFEGYYGPYIFEENKLRFALVKQNPRTNPKAFALEKHKHGWWAINQSPMKFAIVGPYNTSREAHFAEQFIIVENANEVPRH